MTRDEQLERIADVLVHEEHKRDAGVFLAMLEAALANAVVLDERVDPLTERVTRLEARMDALTAPPDPDAHAATVTGHA